MLLSEREQQEARKRAEVPGVIVEPIAGRQTEADLVTLVQLQNHSVGSGGVSSMVVQVKVEDDWLIVPVQV